MDASRWMVRLACVLGVALALVAVSTVPHAAEASPAAPVRAQQVIGSKVLDASGRTAGWVEDLLVDPGRGAIAALIVAHDGRSVELLLEGARFADGVVTVPATDRRIDGLRPWKGPSDPAQRRATALLDKPLRASDGDRVIATVKDLLVDIGSARLTHVVLDFDPAVKKAQGWIAVSMGLVRPEGDSLRAAFDPGNLHDAQAPARAAEAAPQPPPELPGRDARLSRLPGRTVDNGSGASLGKVEAVLADLRARRIAALLVAHGGDLFTCRLGADGLAIGRDRVRAPAAAASLGDVSGCVPGTHNAGVDLARGRELLGARFRDPQGNDVGKLAEVVVKAEDGAFHYYVGDFDAAWVQDGKVVALPLRPIERVDGRLVLRAELMEMMRHPVFDAKRLADAWNPAFAKGMDKYLGASP